MSAFSTRAAKMRVRESETLPARFWHSLISNTSSKNLASIRLRDHGTDINASKVIVRAKLRANLET